MISRNKAEIVVDGDKLKGIVFFIIIEYFFFINLIHQLFGETRSNLFILAGCVILLITAGLFDIREIELDGYWHWILACGIMVYSSRQQLAQGNYYWVLMYVVMTLLMILSSFSTDWIDVAINIIEKTGLIHVIATIVLMVFSPYLYDAIILPIWGGVLPGGEFTAAEAYKAGLCNHYSTNGLYCAIALLCFGAFWMSGTDERVVRYKYLCYLSFFALLVTTKRAHLLFSLFSMCVLYFIYSSKNRTNKVFVISAIITSVLILVYIISLFVPAIGGVVQRFFDQDDISTGRFIWWKQAFMAFKNNLISGVGWLGYSKINIYGTSAHNVYIQLLCETGIIGFLVFMLAMIKTIITSFRTQRDYNEWMKPSEQYGMSFSIAIQVFVLLYCITGNCLYDNTMIIYYIACMLSISIRKAVQNQINEQNEEVF